MSDLSDPAHPQKHTHPANHSTAQPSALLPTQSIIWVNHLTIKTDDAVCHHWAAVS